jgi:hypothetical protein
VKTADKRTPRPTKKALNIANLYSPLDLNGSYTGTPKEKGELPMQDADDL